MNPNCTDVRPRGIEWEFAAGNPAIVAFIPHEEGGPDWECWDVLRADLGDLSILQRETLRAWLRVAQRHLDASEPASTIEVQP